MLANPTAQFLRQMRPVAITPTTSLQAQGGITTTPFAPNSTSTSISAVPILNNSTIRVRLPDTPTLPPNVLQQATQIVQQQTATCPISSNTNISTLVKPTNPLVSTNLQSQQVQHPRTVTIQGNQVIINQQVGQ